MINVFQPPNLVFFVGLVIYCFIRHRFIQITKFENKNIRQVDATEKILLAAMFVTVLVLPLLYLFTPLLSFANYELGGFFRWAGVAVMVFSLWLFRRSHVDLGANWSVSLELREGHQLVSHGVYRRVRHPMYASIWLWGLAQGMTLANWLAGWSALVAFAAMYYIRMPREERLMHGAFGDKYHDYARKTGRLIPRFTRAAEPIVEADVPITRVLK